MNKICIPFIMVVLLLASCQTSQPETYKMDLVRLSQIDSMLTQAIEENSIPGAVALVAKENQIVYKKAFGVKNPDTGEKYQVDDIFRIASMTKAVTSLGVIKLWERGLLRLDEPIEEYIPEFKGVGILDTFDPKDSTFTVKPTEKKITIRNLLTHTAGLGYGFIDGNPSIKAAFVKEKNKFMPDGVLGFSDANVTIEETIKKMAKMPLHHEPGERFTYAIGLDVLGYLIEIISGQSLAEFFEKELFIPMEMNDTYFYLPEEKADQLVPILTKKEEDWIVFEEERYNVNYPIEGAKKFYSGGGGLSSTVEDYFKFLSIFMNDGRYKNTQIISPVTNDLIQRDQLAKITGESNPPLGQGLISGIVRDSDLLTGARGGEGTIFWGGYFNTAYFADPNEKVIGIIYKQTQMIGEPTTELFNQIIFGAITK